MNQLMDTKQHRLGKIKVLTGINWLDPELKDDALTLIKSENISSPGIFSVQHDADSMQYGVCSLKGVKTKGKLLSAAAVVALFQRKEKVDDDLAWIVVEEFQDGFWTCMVSGGTIVAETASGLDKNHLEKEASHFVNSADQGSLKYQFLGSGVYALELREDQFRSDSLNSIIASLVKSDLNKALPVNKSSLSAVKWGFGILLVLSILYVYSLMFDFTLWGKSPEEIRQEQVQDSIRQAKAYYDRFLAEPTLKQSMVDIHRLLTSKRLLDAPWELHQVNCRPADGMCIATYKNPRNLSTHLIADYIQNQCVQLEVDPQGSTANCTLSYDITNEEPGEMGVAITDWTEQLLLMAKTGLLTKIMNPIASNISGAPFAPTNFIHKEGVWEIAGNFQKVSNITESLTKLSWVKARNIKLIHSGGSGSDFPKTEIVIEGAYVIQ